MRDRPVISDPCVNMWQVTLYKPFTVPIFFERAPVLVGQPV
jgi:hypothetical protein